MAIRGEVERKRILVEELGLPDRIIDINELLHLGVLREQTRSVSTDFRFPALTGFRADRYAIQVKFPQKEWLRIALQWTPCPYLRQGPRLGRSYPWKPWMICPFCRRRAGKIYLARDFVACRTCCGLRYASQTLGYNGKRHRQALKIRVRLGGKPVIGAPFPKRPEGMPKKTYARMRARAQQLELPLRTGRYRKYWAWRRPEYPILIRIPRI
jgi:hypothetical protein